MNCKILEIDADVIIWMVESEIGLTKTILIFGRTS